MNRLGTILAALVAAVALALAGASVAGADGDPDMTHNGTDMTHN